MNGYFYYYPGFKDIPVLNANRVAPDQALQNNANSEDPDQTPCFAASDLGLHCLHMSFLWDARHKWVEQEPASLLAKTKQCFFVSFYLFTFSSINIFGINSHVKPFFP